MKAKYILGNYLFLSLNFIKKIEEQIGQYKKILHINYKRSKEVSNIFVLSLILLACVLFAFIFIFPKIAVQTHVIMLIAIAIGVEYSMLYLLLAVRKWYYNNKVYQQLYQLELELPEFYERIGIYLKSGKTLEESLNKAGNECSSMLKYEIQILYTKVSSGGSLAGEIEQLIMKYPSSEGIATLRFLGEGIRGGGNIYQVLLTTAKNLRGHLLLIDEYKAAIGGTLLSLFVITIIVAPLLLSMSYILLFFLLHMFSSVGATDVQDMVIPLEYVEYVYPFSLVLLIILTISVSFIISELKNESSYSAIRYALYMIPCVLLIYSVAVHILQYLFIL